MVSNVLLLASFFIAYALLHSWLASLACKQWARRVFGAVADRVYRMAYNVFAVLAILPLPVLMAHLPDQILYILPSPWMWLAFAVQLLAVLSAAVALVQTDALYFIGIAQVIRTQPPRAGALMVTGAYAWVRHPLYTLALIALWLTPIMTFNLLMVYALFTLYFVIGSIFEERRLIAEFGDVYRAYQQRVPRLVPRFRRRTQLPRADWSKNA